MALAGGCGGLGEWRSFASLVAGQPPFEVCRYMLATLQLVSGGWAPSALLGPPWLCWDSPTTPTSLSLFPQANDYVVELTQEPGLEAALDTARLRLLTHQQAQDRFHTFQPPSLCPLPTTAP